MMHVGSWQQKFFNFRHSRLAKTVTFWPCWQTFNRFCFDTLSFFPLFLLFFFLIRKKVGGWHSSLLHSHPSVSPTLRKYGSILKFPFCCSNVMPSLKSYVVWHAVWTFSATRFEPTTTYLVNEHSINFRYETCFEQGVLWHSSKL